MGHIVMKKSGALQVTSAVAARTLLLKDAAEGRREVPDTAIGTSKAKVKIIAPKIDELLKRRDNGFKIVA